MKLIDRTLVGFLEELGSATPAPGGGSAAALAGATAAALCAMVARLTLGREACRGAWPAAEQALAEAQALEGRLLGLVDEDAAAYAAVVEARALPRGTDGEKAARRREVQAATLRAADVPLQTLETLRECATTAQILVTEGSPGCITDVGTAGALCRAGALAAAYNVRINLSSLSDPAARDRTESRTRAALADVESAAERIGRAVDSRLDAGSNQ